MDALIVEGGDLTSDGLVAIVQLTCSGAPAPGVVLELDSESPIIGYPSGLQVNRLLEHTDESGLAYALNVRATSLCARDSTVSS